MEFLQVTSQYSNAVLVALLPYVSDFAHKLSLPILTPVIPSHVLEFRCSPRRDQIGGLITLTNGCRFSFLDGRVCTYRSPASYFSLPDIDLIPRFYGPVNVREKEAIKIARDVIERLGYAPGAFHAELAPEVTLPRKVGTNYVARYRVRWLDPSWPASKKAAGIVPALMDI
jgi:hypothetical protein